MECEGRDIRRRIPVLRRGEGEYVNLWLLLFLRFCSVIPFLSSMLRGRVFLHAAAVRGCGDASHLFLGCVKVFFAFFDVDGAASLVLPVSNTSSFGQYSLWPCGAC